MSFASHAVSLFHLLRRPPRLQLLAIEAMALLVVLRLMLRFAPFERWRHRLVSVEQEVTSNEDRVGSESRGDVFNCATDASVRLRERSRIAEIVWAVDRVSRRSPTKLTCLPRALAVCQMLKRRGISASLRLGVGRDGQGQFIAHAWVMKDGEVIIGSLPNLASFAVLSSWPGTAQKS